MKLKQFASIRNSDSSGYTIEMFYCPDQDDNDFIINIRKKAARAEQLFIENRKKIDFKIVENRDLGAFIKSCIKEEKRIIKVCNLILTRFNEKNVIIPKELEAEFVMVARELWLDQYGR